MLALTYTLLAMAGFALFAFGFFMVLPAVMIGSPFQLLLAVLTPGRLYHLLRLVEVHIRDHWPDTRVVGVAYHVGYGLIMTAAILFCIDQLG